MVSRSHSPSDPATLLLSDKYEILEVLGGGGMGRVLHARHRQLKSSVAIKLLQHDLGGTEAVTRFLREARTAAQISSAHVAQVMDAGVLPNGHPYIVMEYLRGQDLASWISARGRLPVEQAVDFLLQALEAIAEAHSLEIVHRDIKPGNLFATRIVGGDMSIKVLDFGLAKAGPAFKESGPSITERGAVLGTPSYMAPEQFVDAQQADVRSDIWALGATLFELVTGAPPFSGATLPQIYSAVMHRPIPTIRSLVPGLPAALDDVVATCLTRERELRYADATELAAALQASGGPEAAARVARIARISQSSLHQVGGHHLLEVEPPSLARATPPLPELLSTSRTRRTTRGRALVLAACACGLGLLWIVISHASPSASLGKHSAVTVTLPKPPDAAHIDAQSSRASDGRASVPDRPAPPDAALDVASTPAPDSQLDSAPPPIVVEPAPVPRRRRAETRQRVPAAAPPDRASVYERYP